LGLRNELDLISLWLQATGPRGLLSLVRQRLAGRPPGFIDRHAHLFAGKGLELGGPSGIFSPGSHAPVYGLAGALDNVNFSSTTRWEGDIAQGRTFRFRAGAEPGVQLVHEATSLSSVPDGAYDFVLSSHMLEHTANPLRALHEWKRVMQPGGTLLLVLPHKDGSFDHRRPVTTLAHMQADFEHGVGEDDATHFEEVLRLHDLQRDPGQSSPAAFRAWVEGNAVNRGVHHHVFDSLTAAQLVDAAGFDILCVEPADLSVYVYASRPLATQADNTAFTSPRAAFLRRSLYRSDRLRAAAAT
jgi:SAM-dependent methyltransferase